MRYRTLVVAFLAVCLGVLTTFSQVAFAADDTPLTYAQIKGSGLAKNCPKLPDTEESIKLESGKAYELVDLCLFPANFFVLEEPTTKRQKPRFVTSKEVTFGAGTLDLVRGDLTLGSDNSLTFSETDGYDFGAITVQTPSHELVPFLFTVKGLVAKAKATAEGLSIGTKFTGDYVVPSYRTSAFLDPKGRGLSAGYDTAVALPASGDSEEIRRENVKSFEIGEGTISLKVKNIDSYTGEIGGSFEAIQPSDTDMGSKAPVDVKIQGIFYARVEDA
ncbi:MAG: photosystem II manganese-stabilizing polypeptide [Leptolyngbyaceae cyanobacterium MO_188.B28]|nr:photosystem II manganese-stabilizing polypeptide [Leptolyngbyaceae cyanobacterium MO_188.B28]